MTINFKRTSSAADVCLFGKIPQRADFIRMNASHPGAVHFDRLIADSLQRPDAGEQHSASYRAMGQTSVLLRYQGQLFLGGIMPSYDQAGRDYPLVAGVFMPEATPSLSLAHLLLAKEVFFHGLQQQFESAFSRSVDMQGCRTFFEQQLQQGITIDADLNLARQLLERHLQHCTAGELNRMLAAAGLGSLSTLLPGFIFQRLLQKKFASSLPAPLFLLPLPDQDGEDMLYAAAWLALYQAATIKESARSEQFLLLRGQGQRLLALAPAALTRQHLQLCWGRQPDSGIVFDASDESAPWRGDQAYAETAYVLGKRLYDDQVSIAEVRDVLRNVVQSMA